MPLLSRVRSMILLLLMVAIGFPVVARELSCGIALGFPPYQYRDGSQEAGFDADVARLVMARLAHRCRFVQEPWDQILNQLRYGKLDLVVGMEINAQREKYFDFTTPYMARQSVIFVNAQTSRVQRIDELFGQFIAGDRSSKIEQLWQDLGIRTRFRIRELDSKSAAMAFLKSGRVQAAIMPLEVGVYLAREHQLTVRVLAEPRVDTPVAIAVEKGNQTLRQQLDGAVRELIASGEIAALYQRWFGVPFEAAASQSPRRGH